MVKNVVKKLIAMAVMSTLVLGTMGCSSKNDAAKNDGSKKTKVTCLVGIKSDKSFFESANNGMERVKKEFGDKYDVNVIEMTADTSKWKDALLEAADSDADIVISGCYTMQEYLEEIVPEKKDKKFVFFDGSLDYDAYDLVNAYSIGYQTSEGAFLAGMAAAHATTSGHEKTNPEKVLGFVGAVENNPIINDFLVGFIEGAKYVDPEIKVVTSYIGNYEDTAKAKELALVQYTKDKADIVFPVCGTASAGVVEAGYQQNAIAIGVDSDQSLMYEGRKEQQTIMTSVLKRVDNSLYKALKDNIDGTAKFGKYELLGLNDDSVGIVYNDILSSYVDADFIAKIKQAEQDIKDGKIKVSSAMKLSINEVQKIIDSAK